MFRLKRFPSGLLRKVKARFCARGDLQDDVDVFDTYAPVASWSSIRMLTVTAMQKGWITRQIDFSNAFVQAPMSRDVYVSLPAMFADSNSIESKLLCLKLRKRLYGLKDAPKLWHDWLAKGLSKAQFTPSDSDPGIYFGRGMCLVVYVDDVLLFGPNEEDMEKVISELQLDGFDLKLEKTGAEKAYDFLGIHITEEIDAETNSKVIKMTQLGLIKKFLECVQMVDCNPSPTPCTVQPLGTDANGKRFSETWEYASAVGMLMYLAGNAYPEIQYAVHQCARFTHAPRQSHAVAVKRIAHYLKGVLDQEGGLCYKVSSDLNFDMYCDADYAGLWTYEDDQDPVCVRSRTGYVMTLGGCPVHWTSKLQTEIALSTLEAEYIALAQGMREFVHLRRFYVEMLLNFDIFKDSQSIVKSKIFEDNNGCISTATAPKLTPRTKHISVKYHFVRNYFNLDPQKKTIHPFILEKIASEEQKADLFTKGFNPETFLRLRKLLFKW